MFFFKQISKICVVLVLVVSMFASCSRVAEYAADKIYPDLQTYYDTEAPPTPLPFPASSSITAIIGGRGEGLNCSIPALLEWAMFDREQGDAPISLQFKQACNYHDFCYRHGHATYGYTRNHCDYALQQIAYRTCRVRSSQSPQDCLSRARRLLLGVTLGGGRAFSAHEHSTYFEFDPMPDKADDYVVVRWVKSNDRVLLKGKPLNGRFIVMHYKRGTVASKAVNFDPSQAPLVEPQPQLFPSRHIATPPFVVRVSNRDRLWAVARNNFQDTRIKVVEYKSPVEGRRPDPIQEMPGFDDDPDASVFWFPMARPGELSYWSYTEDFGTANIANRLMHKQVIHSSYRTLQHAPLEGNFFTSNCLDTAVMKRGGPQVSSQDDNGGGFDRQAHLIFVRPTTPPCVSRQPVTLEATQEHEPLAVVRLDSGRDVLLGIREVAKRVQLSFFDLAIATGSTPVRPIAMTLPEQFDASWLRIPPQIVWDNQSGASILFFSRYTRPDLERGSKMARFEFAYFRLAAGDSTSSLVAAGSGRCTVDLSGQLAFVSTATLGKNIARSFPNGPERKKKAAYVSFFNAKIAPAILSDINERWANAQVIPGWFLKKENVAGSKPLDVAVFFRGYSQYSFLARGTFSAPGVPAGLEAVAPSYVKCNQ